MSGNDGRYLPAKHHRGSYRLGLDAPQPHRVFHSSMEQRHPPPRRKPATSPLEPIDRRVICMQTVHALKHGGAKSMNISDNAQKSPDWLRIASDSNSGPALAAQS